MSSPTARPKWVDDLILGLGAEMGFEGLSLVDDVLELDFAGTELGLFFVAQTPLAGPSILLKSALDLPLHLPAPILALLMDMNLSTFAAGRGFAALDTGFGFWVWTDRIELAGLTPPRFRLRLEQAATAARDWAARIPDLLQQASAPDQPADARPEPDDTSILFRL